MNMNVRRVVKRVQASDNLQNIEWLDRCRLSHQLPERVQVRPSRTRCISQYVVMSSHSQYHSTCSRLATRPRRHCKRTPRSMSKSASADTSNTTQCVLLRSLSLPSLPVLTNSLILRANDPSWGERREPDHTTSLKTISTCQHA